MSDTHGLHKQVAVPPGDVLVFAGDFTSSGRGNNTETSEFNSWLHSLPHQHKLVVAGNHERLNSLAAALPAATYLQDSMVRLTIRDSELLVWGSPWQPQWVGFDSYVDKSQIGEKWRKIPENLHILITHTPPHSRGDWMFMRSEDKEGHFGDDALLHRLQQLSHPPLLHVYGHIHTGYGQIEEIGGTLSINAALTDDTWRQKHIVNPPIVVTLQIP